MAQNDVGMDYERAQNWSKRVEAQTSKVNKIIERVEKTLTNNEAQQDELTTTIELVTKPIIENGRNMANSFFNFAENLIKMISRSLESATQGKNRLNQLND